MREGVLDEPRTLPATVRPRRALRRVVGVAARIIFAGAGGLLLNLAGYSVVGARFASRCHASGGVDCPVAAVLAIALLLGVPAVYVVVAARSAVFSALTALVLDPAVGASEWLLRPIAKTLVARLPIPSRMGARRLDLTLDEYPFFLRNGLRVALLVSGLAKLSRSAAYLQAAGGTDPTAAVTRLLQQDLRKAAARRRSVFPWSIVALNVGLLAASWAVVLYVEWR